MCFVVIRHGKYPHYSVIPELLRNGKLGRCGKDTHNAKYICPDSLQMAHDHWQSHVTAMEEKHRNEERFR